MVVPTDQHLYVMQNEFGLIRVGRSLDVERRRMSLQTSERCQIEIVEVYLNCGDMEEDIHIDLDEFRLAGEWFDGSDTARAMLSTLIACEDPPIIWPFNYDPQGAREWLDHIETVRQASAIRRELYRQIAILRAADGPHGVHDGHIFFVSFRAATGRRPRLVSGRRDGERITHWSDPITGVSGVVPAFTASVENALLAWPEDVRPSSWDGKPIDCCIAALAAIREGLPRIPRRFDNGWPE